RRLAGLFIAFGECASEERRGAEKLKGVGGDLRAAHRLDASVGRREVALEIHGGADMVDRFELPAPDGEILEHSPFGCGGGDVPVANRDDAVGVGYRQTRVAPLVERLEVERAEGDRDRDSDGGNEGESGVASEHADAEAHIKGEGEVRESETVGQ